MKIDKEILEVVSKDEAERLIKLYGTDLYAPYIRTLKKKYLNLYFIIEDNFDDPLDSA